MICFSLRLSLQFWYRSKEGNNSKFEVDSSKRSRVRAERSWKVERKSSRTFEFCSVAQSLFRLSLLFVCLFVFLFILGRKLNRQNCLLKEVLREREEKEEKEKKKSN